MTETSRWLPIPELSERDLERWHSTPRVFIDDGGGDQCEIFGGPERNLGKGYKTFQLNVDGRWTVFQAHRVALVVDLGIDPLSASVEHACGRRGCVNPRHLLLMSLRANVLAATSNGMGRINATKTACVSGHEFTAANTIRRHDSRGRESRACRACQRARARRKAEAAGRQYVPQAERDRRAKVRKEQQRKATEEAKARREQYCKRGHPRTEENTRADARPGRASGVQRTCTACERERQRARAARLKAEGVATPTVTA